MKLKTFSQLYIATLLLFFVAIACNDDPCQGLNCANGVCDTVSGDCLCSNGYQADSSGICMVEWSAKFVKTYNVSDSCIGAHPGSMTYSSNITAPAPNKVLLSNFANLGRSMEATHTSSISFDINHTSNDTIFTGSGLLQDTILYIDYIVNDTTNQSIDTCRAAYN